MSGITCVGVNSLLINGVDVQTWCAITNAEGLLSDAPQKGDLIEGDWTPGASWQKGPKGVYSFPVPVIMRSAQQDVAFGQLRALQAYVGQQVTLTRRLVVDGATVSETCQAVMTAAVQVQWELADRSEKKPSLRAVLVWQNLSAGWAAA